MLNVENINKNVEMLKNVDTKIKFFDTNNFFFDKEFKKIISNPFNQHLFLALLMSKVVYCNKLCTMYCTLVQYTVRVQYICKNNMYILYNT